MYSKFQCFFFRYAKFSGLKAKGHWETFIRIQGWHIASNVALSVKQSVHRTYGLCIIHSRLHRIQFSMAPSVFIAFFVMLILVRSQNNWVVSIHKSRRKPRLAGRAVLKIVFNPIWSLLFSLTLQWFNKDTCICLLLQYFFWTYLYFFLNSLYFFLFCVLHSSFVYILFEISSFSNKNEWNLESQSQNEGHLRDLFAFLLQAWRPGARWVFPKGPWVCHNELKKVFWAPKWIHGDLENYHGNSEFTEILEQLQMILLMLRLGSCTFLSHSSQSLRDSELT